MTKSRTRRETERALVELLRDGKTRAAAAEALGVQRNSIATIIHEMRRAGRWPLDLVEVSAATPFELDDDESRPCIEANVRHLRDLEREHAYGAGELNIEPCDIGQAVMNTRRLMRQAGASASYLSSPAGLCAESHQ
ncbi:helix-turn-helix domain-containing protein [Rhodoblastus sp. 17X3]|uniref:helix-turn-helix domain-containing protein n=1 Tax=Rhodoblastus sp. 17X3 TaxID=3047026 RepID=UPI0024B81D07|nr:helix-turn-helix domain-containing protein [Rhodoblastus sp. 17X3]MDI9847350.1 helix-turn-helix domain-containing protein [Rhodoblastus sp. 17X3]